MGLETAIALAALQVGGGILKASSERSAAKKQAAAAVEQGNIASRNKAKEISAKAASQKVSFLNSGLTLEGTPSGIIGATFQTGMEDLNLISSNANRQAKNAISAGRNAAISSIVSGVTSAGMMFGGMPGGTSPTGATPINTSGTLPWNGLPSGSQQIDTSGGLPWNPRTPGVF